MTAGTVSAGTVLAQTGTKRTASKPAIAKPPVAKPTPAATATPAVPGAPRPKPIGNPAEWFPANAYPPEARNAGQEGRTVFMVKVDAQGRIMECDIVQTSGSLILDNTTCDLVVSHGRFQPARDAEGKAVAGVWHSAMRWQLVVTAPTVDDEDNQ